MEIITSFNRWVSSYSLNESFKAAKIYMQNRLEQEMRKKGETLTPEEAVGSSEDPKYLEIAEMLTDSRSGYALPFVKFHFEQGVPIKGLTKEGEDIKTLEGLLDFIEKKGHIIKQLSVPIEKRAMDKFSEGTTGFEKLADEIRTVERTQSAKWFVDRLPLTLRNQFRALNKEKQARVTNQAIQLKDLGVVPIGRLFSRIKAMEKEYSTDGLIDYVGQYIAGYHDNVMGSKIRQLEKLEPEAGLIYSDDRYLVMSMRTEKAQKDLCAIANWCINTGAFSQYAENAVQLNIFDFGRTTDNPMHLTGTTVYYSGKVYTSSDLNNKPIAKSSDLGEHLKKLKYPAILISAVLQGFNDEALVKKVVYDLNLDTATPAALLKSIILQSYRIDPSSNRDTLTIIMEIIDTRIKENLKKSQVVKMYSEYGVLSKFSAQVLKSMLANLSPKEMKSIIDATISIFAEVNLIAKEEPTLISQQMRNILAQEEAVTQELNLPRA